MGEKVVELGAHVRMSTKDALGLVGREDPSEVLILYEDGEGRVCIRSSGMKREKALWLLEDAKLQVLGFGGDDV